MLLTDNDRNALEACDENGVTNVGRIFALLDNFVEEGVQQGRFSREEADADLEIALWRSFARPPQRKYLPLCAWLENGDSASCRNAATLQPWAAQHRNQKALPTAARSFSVSPA